MLFNLFHIVAVSAIISSSLAAPMWKEGTCGPEEDLACYPDGSNGKRSPAGLTARRLPTITAPTIPPLGAPTGGVDGGGYLRRSLPTGKDDSIVIGSRRSPEEPAPAEDVGAYDEEKRSLSLDAAGHPILTGDNYPTKRHFVVDEEDYPPEDGANYGKREAMLPIDGDYPVPNDDSYPVKAKRLLDAGIYELDD